MSETAAWISAGAALFSVGAAIWATVRSAKAHKDALDVHSVLKDIEVARECDRLAAQKKAGLRAEIVPDSSRSGIGGHKVKLHNPGPAKARNISITVNDKPLDQHAAPVGRPVALPPLGPSESYEYWLNNGLRAPFDVRLLWDDDSEVRGSFSATYTE